MSPDTTSRIAARLAELARKLEHQSDFSRGETNREIWTLQRALGATPAYFSEAGQDMALDLHVFAGKRHGTFVEVGGNDGITGSTCLFFELFRHWDGLLIEADPQHLASAAEFRRCKCVQAVIAPTATQAKFLKLGNEDHSRLGSGLIDHLPEKTLNHPNYDKAKKSEIDVQTQTLPDILRTNGMSHIDYLSIDIEGIEMEVFKVFPFDEFTIDAISVENHKQNVDIQNLLAPHGFELIDYLGFDELYVHSRAKNLHTTAN